MQLIDNLRNKPLVKKVEKFVPAIAFVGGFSWDSITLGREIDNSDLLFLLAYFTGALILVILLSAHREYPEGWTQERIMAAKVSSEENKDSTNETDKPKPSPTEAIVAVAHKVMNIVKPSVPKDAIVEKRRFLDRDWSDAWKDRISWMLQFCFGSMFSALVVCYFKSSGSLASLLLVIVLAILLVGNEFLKKKYESFTVSLAFFCLLGTMFMNFTIPHIVHRIGFLWFFLSTFISFMICWGIKMISHRKKRVLIAPGIISGLLIIAYLMNWVPPVPLVLKQQMVCQNFERKNFSCDVDKPTFLQNIGIKLPSVHRINKSDVYFLSSVYAPAELKAELEYRWYYMDPMTGEYRLTDKIATGRMKLVGGRVSGYRTYSKKQHIPAGRYNVEVAYKNGAVIGSQKFEVFEDVPPPKGFVRDSLR